MQLSGYTLGNKNDDDAIIRMYVNDIYPVSK